MTYTHFKTEDYKLVFASVDFISVTTWSTDRITPLMPRSGGLKPYGYTLKKTLQSENLFIILGKS
jgi:hypothetical protein